MNRYWRLGLTTLLLYLAVTGTACAGNKPKSTDNSSSQNMAGVEQAISPVMPDEASSGYWGLQWENDYLGGGTDRYYTQGLEISYARKGEIPDWLKRLGKRLPSYETSDRSGVVYSLGQKMYTPADISANPPDPTDRPYAGFLYSSLAYVDSVEINPWLQHVNVFELMLGIVGPSSLAEELQDTVHPLVRAKLAQGWGYQLKDELGLGCSYVHKWRHFSSSFVGKELEVSPHVTATLGNVYTYVASGVMFRWGRGLKMDMGPPNIRPGFTGSTYFVPHFRPNWYLFMGLEGRLMARNIFLDGNSLVDSPRVSKIPLVGDLQIGFAIHMGKMRFAFSNVLRSREFTTQTYTTQFGSINFSYYF